MFPMAYDEVALRFSNANKTGIYVYLIQTSNRIAGEATEAGPHWHTLYKKYLSFSFEEIINLLATVVVVFLRQFQLIRPLHNIVQSGANGTQRMHNLRQHCESA